LPSEGKRQPTTAAGKLKGWAGAWMSHDGFHEKIGSETPTLGVAQVVGFGLGMSKMLYRSMGID
jgi:hypothetical protein